jgi:hypothetical protein
LAGKDKLVKRGKGVVGARKGVVFNDILHSGDEEDPPILPEGHTLLPDSSHVESSHQNNVEATQNRDKDGEEDWDWSNDQRIMGMRTDGHEKMGVRILEDELDVRVEKIQKRLGRLCKIRVGKALTPEEVRMCIYVCFCVCVCVREREREKESVCA